MMMTSISPSLSLTPPTKTPTAEQINDKIQTHVGEATELAKQILKDEYPGGASTTVIQHHYYTHWWWPWHSAMNYQTSYRSRHEDGKAELAMLGVIGIIYSVIRVAQSVGSLIGASRELQKVRKFKKTLKDPDTVLFSLGTIKKIAKLKIRIFERVKSDAVSHILLKSFLGVGCGMVIGGLLKKNDAWGYTGMAMAAGGTLGSLIKWAFDTTETRNKADARKIYNKIVEFKKHKRSFVPPEIVTKPNEEIEPSVREKLSPTLNYSNESGSSQSESKEREDLTSSKSESSSHSSYSRRTSSSYQGSSSLASPL